MKKAKLLGMIVCAALLTGCGGEYAGVSEGDIVSGSAVSGDAVSGPSVEDGKEKSQNGEKQDMSSHRFCTDTNLYYIEADTQIMQAETDGTQRRCIREWREDDGVEATKVEIIYVEMDWLYYHVADNETDDYITYRAPIEKDVQGYEVVRFSQEEEIVKTNFMTPLYMDSDYYFYTDDMDELIKYDLKRKEIISRKKKQPEFMEGEGNIFRLNDHYFLSADTGCCYVQEIDSGQWEKICDRMVKIEYDQIYYELSVNNGREVFYPRYVTKKGEQESLYESTIGSPFDIIGCDGEKERYFVTWEQVSHAVEKMAGTQKLDFCMPDRMFWQEGRLYLQIQAGWQKEGLYHMGYMVFSQGENDSELRYEKKLTKCMKSHVKERTGKWTDGYEKDETVYVEHIAVNNAKCIAMVDGTAYLSLYDYEKGKQRIGCYDLDTGKFRWITRKDAALYKLGWDDSHALFVTASILDYPDFYQEEDEDPDEWFWWPSKTKDKYGYFQEDQRDML